MIKLIIIAIIIIAFVFLGFAIKVLCTKKSALQGGSCCSGNEKENKPQSFNCGCNSSNCNN